MKEIKKIIALTSQLYSFITRKRTIIKVKLPVILHGFTRSRDNIELMHKFSLGIGYKDDLNLHDTWASSDLVKENLS